MNYHGTLLSPSAWPVFSRFRLYFVSVCATVAIAAVPVHAAEAVDRMNGIGMPILFLVMLLCILMKSRRILRAAFTVSCADTATCICFFASLINMLLSVFLFFTTAFNYGLVSTVLAYCMVFVATSGPLELHARWFLSLYMVWFLLLVGFPTGWGRGIIGATNSDDCVAFYSTYASTMCADGWLTFVKILACLNISITMLSLMLLIAVVLGVEEELLTFGLNDIYRGRNALETGLAREQAPPASYHRI
ncbi:hypothetical protein TcYC6_0114700 [Trypanosoma cruzi]|uniref:Uncharacterized protein n=2 Tax=Trypanosoma cruzi TaxID=5693 RepID=Q4CYA5_TRYCC|nr:hypothetical protein Tc00.1047053509649.40 [Trypanosoma cruzi]EAN85257.1 hypothetical protein Tc00.1047053509649.40 [Trypanosoma cruzi]KAF5225713.1 hypothetical protein ECC02_001029 [Trypanosoma cruzi]KAF8292596.1 hypothetical protein TcYC6_0114700 [Trypanosoma cruzi]|eukprot:XP_807108.1 hypothetical protein [Trypanosoma cruzi strain CL Brener]